jgi:hypothetical protein
VSANRWWNDTYKLGWAIMIAVLTVCGSCCGLVGFLIGALGR